MLVGFFSKFGLIRTNSNYISLIIRFFLNEILDTKDKQQHSQFIKRKG
jgi:hypothetical protein